jgi:formylglycine-generating enzyme required for sulfatase activity
MRPSLALLRAGLLVAVIGIFTCASASRLEYANVDVHVALGTSPLAGATVSLDLNGNGVWDPGLDEPQAITGGDGVVSFTDILSIEDPGAGGIDQSGAGQWRPSRILTGNLRGTVGSRDVQLDFVLPPGAGPASLGLYDLRGRCVAQTRSAGDLVLNLPRKLPTGVYFVRLSANPSAPVSHRVTNIGVRIQTIKAHRLSIDEAFSAGWADPGDRGRQKHQTDVFRVNLLVAHDDYPTVTQPEIVAPGDNVFAVDVEPDYLASFVHIQPGAFDMGSPPPEPGRDEELETLHTVTLTRGFYISKYEVTEVWWDEVMGGSVTAHLPKNSVTWHDAVAFCNALSLQQGLAPAYTIDGGSGEVTWDRDADGYRLPTEAEWEYACRAGTQTAFSSGPILHTDCDPLDPSLDQVGWYCGNNTPSGRKVVGQKRPNAWSLYDMHGNLSEWVWDGLDPFDASPREDPVFDVGPGENRVWRGGYWGDQAADCRAAERNGSNPGWSFFSRGFRPARSAAAPGGVIRLPRTGQTRCYDASGVEIPCAGTGQDGEFQAGVAIPSPRFTVIYCDADGPCPDQNSDCDGLTETDVVLDYLTGLMWARVDIYHKTWFEALTAAAGSNLGGFTDWRVPNVNELESLFEAGEVWPAAALNEKGFALNHFHRYWTSTWLATQYNPNLAWDITYDGFLGGSFRTSLLEVIIVRGETTLPARLWRTGQSISVAAGDDGDLQQGVAWPDPRFADNGDGTVTDNLTGLVWLRNANCIWTNHQEFDLDGKVAWQSALNFVAGINDGTYGDCGAGYTDWRLPNKKELYTLVDYDSRNPALQDGHPFQNVLAWRYWSSSTRYEVPIEAWVVDLAYGDFYSDYKTGGESAVWPVRGPIGR